MERKVNSGLRKLACAGVATLALGGANANSLDDYVSNNNLKNNETFEVLNYDSKDAAQFGGGLVAGLLSHEIAHKLVGDALGMDASYNPLKDPFTTYYDNAPDSKLEQALFSGAGLITQNAASAAIVNSDIDLKENPVALGYLAFAIGNNLKYAFFPNDRGEASDSRALSEATGISQKVISGALIASSIYLGKKIFDNFSGEVSSDIASNFSPHFGKDGNFGVQYKTDKSLWSVSAEVNPGEKYVGLVLNVSLDGKRK